MLKEVNIKRKDEMKSYNYSSSRKCEVPKTLFVFAFNCILAHIIDARNYCKYIGNGSTVYMVKRLAT